jgi:hypothetical protein
LSLDCRLRLGASKPPLLPSGPPHFRASGCPRSCYLLPKNCDLPPGRPRHGQPKNPA